MPLKLFNRSRKPSIRNPPAFRYEYSEELPPPLPIVSSPSSVHAPSPLSPDAVASTSSLLTVPPDHNVAPTSLAETSPRKRKPSIKAVIGLPIARAFGAAITSKGKDEDCLPATTPRFGADTIRGFRRSRPSSSWVDIDPAELPPDSAPAPRISSSAPATPFQASPTDTSIKSPLLDSVSFLGRFRGKRDRVKASSELLSLNRKSSASSALHKAFKSRLSHSPPPPLPSPLQSANSNCDSAPLTSPGPAQASPIDVSATIAAPDKRVNRLSSGFELKSFRNVRAVTTTSANDSCHSISTQKGLQNEIPDTPTPMHARSLSLSVAPESSLPLGRRSRQGSTTSLSSSESGPRMSAAAFREAMKTRSSLAQGSYGSDVGLPLTASALEAHSPASSWRSLKSSPRIGLRAVSDIGVPSLSRGSAAAAAAARKPSAAAIAAAIQAKRMQNHVPLISRIPAYPGQINDSEILAPPRPAFYGMGSQNRASNSSLSGDSSGRRTPATPGVMGSANQSKASLNSVRSSSRPLSVNLSHNPQASLSSRQSSCEGWQTAHSSDEESGSEGGEEARKERLASANLFGSRRGSQVAPTKSSSPSRTGILLSPGLRRPSSPPCLLAPKANESALGSDEEDEVPLSKLKQRIGRSSGSFHSISGSTIITREPSSFSLPDRECLMAETTTPTATSPNKSSLWAIQSASSIPQVTDRELQQSPTFATPQLPPSDVPTVIGRSVSALSLTSNASYSRSESASSLPRPSQATPTPLVPVITAPNPISLMRQPDAGASLPSASIFGAYPQPRGNSPASSSSGSGSWTAPLTPRDSIPPLIGPVNMASGKPRVSFDPNVVERDGPKRIGKPLFTGSLAVPPQGGLRPQSVSISKRQSLDAAGPNVDRGRDLTRLRSNARRSVSESNLMPQHSNEDLHGQFKPRHQGLNAASPNASPDHDGFAGDDEDLNEVNMNRTIRNYHLPAPPGVDPFLYASLPPDQKLQLHQRSQMMMQMMAAQAAQMHAMAMSQSNTLLQPSMSWDAGSAIGSSNGNGSGGSMIGLRHRPVPSMPILPSSQMMGYGYPMANPSTATTQAQHRPYLSYGGIPSNASGYINLMSPGGAAAGGVGGRMSNSSSNHFTHHHNNSMTTIGVGGGNGKKHWGSASALGQPTSSRTLRANQSTNQIVTRDSEPEEFGQVRHRPKSTASLGNLSAQRMSWANEYASQSSLQLNRTVKPTTITRQQTNLRFEKSS